MSNILFTRNNSVSFFGMCLKRIFHKKWKNNSGKIFLLKKAQYIVQMAKKWKIGNRLGMIVHSALGLAKSSRVVHCSDKQWLIKLLSRAALVCSYPASYIFQSSTRQERLRNKNDLNSILTIV